MIGMGWIRPAATTIVVAANEGDGDQQKLQHARLSHMLLIFLLWQLPQFAFSG